MISSINGVKISRLAVAVPDNWKSIEELTGGVPQRELDKFKKKTGITGWYEMLYDQTASDLCVEAANRIIQDKDIEDIGILIYISQTPDYIRPSTAFQIGSRLGLKKSSICFDVNLGCVGFVDGLNVAMSILSSSDQKNALLLCGQSASKIPNNERAFKHNSWIFGNAGAACLLEKTEYSCETVFFSSTDTEGYKLIMTPEGIRHHSNANFDNLIGIMDELSVFEFSINEVPAQIKEYMEFAGTTPEDYDSLVLHQANLYIMKSGFTMDKCLVSLDTIGNTASVSIPSAIVKKYGEEHRDEFIKLLICGYGNGLSWSTSSVKINIDDIYPIIKTSEVFDDGIEI